MLRASSKAEGKNIALRGIVDREAPPPAVAQSEILLEFADAAVQRDVPTALASARDKVRAALGPGALVDAAVLVGNFERMNRIADACGIALGPLAAMFRDVVEELDRAFQEQSNPVAS